MIVASIIICSHNPRCDYLRRVLEALRAQTLPKDQWELLLVDNASERVLANDWDLSWHPLARHVREEALGLTSARLRGIAETTGKFLVFVDDDNVLDPDYLQTALEIARDYPFLGAWGGTIRGAFEAEPEEWVRPLTVYLAIREISKPVWSNNPEDREVGPYGAGLCVRRSVATAYAEQLIVSPARRNLGRIGSKLSSCDDSDLVLTCYDLGQGWGIFPQLRLTHLIPKNRVQAEYLISLKQGIETSVILLRYFRTGDLPLAPSTLKNWFKYALIRARRGRRQACLYKASQEATREGIRLAQEFAEQQTRAVSQ
jgi:Glycosyl transferase family 2